MASIAFTEALTVANHFFGRASVGLKPYASGSLSDVGGLDIDQDVEFSIEGEIIEDEVHRQNGPITVYLVKGICQVAFMPRERTIELISKMFGKDDSDITDNTGNTPTDKEVAFGDQSSIDPSFWRVQVQIPQSRATSPLYDFAIMPKAYVDPNGTWKFGRRVKQSRPMVLKGIIDPADSDYPGASCYWKSEYS